ncbi:hypothetical protein BASA60_003462 [Batrachochytrium salamandrivorans]|nr:hypothetical protein BASA60_003462 [Batrachochytrium salamandrivorans]
MQFFHLVSFVAVASYAAALPQPAGLSEKDSATLVLLKRQDNSGSGQPPRPASFRGAAPNRLYNPFDRTETTSANISTTIDNVGGDGVPKMLAGEEEIPEIFAAGVKAGTRMGGNAGALLTRYLRRTQYVALALDRWRELDIDNMFSIIRSVLSQGEYSGITRPVIRRNIDLNNVVQDKVIEALDAVSNIEKNIGTHIENMEKISEAFRGSFNNRVLLLENIRSVLENRPAGQTLYEYLSKARVSLDKFIADQKSLYDEIINELKAAPSQ